MIKISGMMIAVAVVLSMLAGSSAQTQTPYNITFQFKSNYKYKVQVAFWSKSRNVVWPGNGRAYNLDDSQVHQVKLNCLGGERICYGGWVTGNANLHWGVGADGKRGCQSCCYTCGDDKMTPIINLNN